MRPMQITPTRQPVLRLAYSASTSCCAERIVSVNTWDCVPFVV